MKGKKKIFRTLAMTVALLAAGQSAWATATTKTMTYTLSREKDNNNEYWVLTHSGSTPFDQTTTVDRQPTTGTSATFQLPDGFIFTFNWKGGMVTKVSPSGDFFCTENPQFNLVWDFTSRYVTKVSVTANDGTVTALDGGGSASTDHVCLEHGPVSYTAAGNAYFAKLVITYTDVPNLNIFTQLGDKIYEIKSKDDLRYLAEFVNNDEDMNTGGRTFRQTQDITFTYTTAWDDPSSEENNYIAIGTAANQFWGTYDGQGHTISGIRIYRADVSNQGLFGKIYNGTVRGVKLADARITGKLYVGGIVGSMSSTTIEDCTVANNVCIHAVKDESNYHGGIVGFSNGTVQRCLSQATLTIANASDCMNYGAIVGGNDKTVNDCIAVDAIVPGVSNAGAIIGKNKSSSTVQRNYYRACTVAGTANAIGVGVGRDDNNSPHDITTKQGAQALYSLTLPSDVTLERTASATLPGAGNKTYTTGADIEGTPYAFSGATLNLSYTGGSGAGVAYTVTKTSDGSDVTADVLSGTTLTMPAYDVTVNAVIYAQGESESNPFVVSTWADLKAKMDEGGYIRLDADVTDPDKNAESCLIVPGGKTVTLDLNGHTIDRGMTGGIYRGRVIYVEGSLTLNDSGTGGTITGGYSNQGGGVGVGGSFTMNGGAISGNTSGDLGGGVFVSNGTFTMNGGAISGNTSGKSGGGVYLTNYSSGNSTFTMNGGTISGNTCGIHGGGVNNNDCYQKNTIRVSGTPVISGNTNATGKEENFYTENSLNTIIIYGPLSDGASIGVTIPNPDITGGSPEVIATGATDGDSQFFHSDLNGYTIEEGEGEHAGKLLLTPPASTPWSELRAQLEAGGTVTLADDVTALDCDGGYAKITGTVTLTATLDLNGHNITVNENSDHIIFIGENGNFTLTGNGTVSGSKEDAVNCYYSTSTFTMNGGTISGGTGGGVYVRNGTFNVSGSPVITGNTKDGNACNVYLNQPKNKDQLIIHVTGPLGADARIGVKTKTAPTAGNPVTFAQGSGYPLTAADASRFSSDVSDYYVGYDNVNHVAYLTVDPSDAGIVGITLTGALSGGFYWATFYNQNLRFTLPEGAAAYTMDASHHLYRLGSDGRTIPAGKAVVIISDKQDITLTLDDGNATVTDHSGGNILNGGPVTLDGDGKVPVPGSDPEVKGYPYVLSIDEGGAIGFRQFTGAAIPAGKAYYVVVAP